MTFSLDVQNLKSISELFAYYWYLFLPLSIFVLIFPNLVELITLFALGLIVGYGYVSPVLYEFIQRFLPDISAVIKNNMLLYVLVVSVIFSVIFYSLYKSIVFLGSFVVSFIAANFLIKSFLINYLPLEWYAYIVIGIIVGLIGGFYAVKNSSVFIGFIAIALGSFVLVAIAFFMFDKYVLQLNPTVFGWGVFVLSLFIFLFRITKLWGSNK